MHILKGSRQTLWYLYANSSMGSPNIRVQPVCQPSWIYTWKVRREHWLHESYDRFSFGPIDVGPKIQDLSRGPVFLIFFKGLVAVCHSFCLFFIFYNIQYIQSSNNTHTIHSPRPLSISSSLVSSVGQTSLWCRAENRTRACLPASRRATTPHHNF